MNATYITRSTADFADVLLEKSNEDLLTRAEILSHSEDPDGIFRELRLETKVPYGVLLLFSSRPEREREAGEIPCIGNVQELETVLRDLMDAEPFTLKDYADARGDYIKASEEYTQAKNLVKQYNQELHSLETGLKNTETQKEWLNKENQTRILRIENCEREIREYENVLKKETVKDEERQKEILKLEETLSGLKTELRDWETQKKNIQAEESTLLGQVGFSNKLFHPKESKERESILFRLNQTQKTIEDKILKLKEDIRLKESEKREYRESSASFQAKKERIEASLRATRDGLDKANKDIERGKRMVEESRKRVDGTNERIHALMEKEMEARTMQEEADADRLNAAEYLLDVWKGCSKKYKEILEMNEVNATDLLQTVFFACGTLCASGSTACEYLEGFDVSLNYLFLYNTKEEKPGFWNIICFEKEK